MLQELPELAGIFGLGEAATDADDGDEVSVGRLVGLCLCPMVEQVDESG